MKFNIVRNDGDASSATVFTDDGQMLVATQDHPQFANIITALEGGETDIDRITGLFDFQRGINKAFSRISERVYIKAGKVFFDAMPQDGALAETIAAFWANGNDNLMALVNFMEKIKTNPNPFSQEHLFRWIKANKFGLTEDGDIIGYKGCSTKWQDNLDVAISTRAGFAIVNGEPMNGYVPQRQGTVVEMPRDMVTFDPQNLCSVGLHVADWSYAQGMGPVIVRVLVNPRDVVSITHDERDRKMRVCRYKVLDRVKEQDTSMLFVDRELALMTARASEYGSRTTTVAKKAAAPVKKGAPAKPVAKKAAATKAKPPVKSKVAKKVVAPKGTPKPQLTHRDDKKPVTKTAKAAAVRGKTVAPTKGAPAAKVTKADKPKAKFYEEFTKDDFAKLPYRTCQWLCKQWEVTPAGRDAASLIDALTKAAKARLRKVKGDRTTIK